MVVVVQPEAFDRIVDLAVLGIPAVPFALVAAVPFALVAAVPFDFAVLVAQVVVASEGECLLGQQSVGKCISLGCTSEERVARGKRIALGTWWHRLAGSPRSI